MFGIMTMLRAIHRKLETIQEILVVTKQHAARAHASAERSEARLAKIELLLAAHNGERVKAPTVERLGLKMPPPPIGHPFSPGKDRPKLKGPLAAPPPPPALPLPEIHGTGVLENSPIPGNVVGFRRAQQEYRDNAAANEESEGGE